MLRPKVLIVLIGTVLFLAFLVLLQSPGTLSEALVRPFHALMGTQQQINATLLEASESADTLRAAGRRLLKPFGVVRLDRIYAAPDLDKKN
jgi:hypothetical protein